MKRRGSSYGKRKPIRGPAAAAVMLGIFTVSNYPRKHFIAESEDHKGKILPTIEEKESGCAEKPEPFSYYLDSFDLKMQVKVKGKFGGSEGPVSTKGNGGRWPDKTVSSSDSCLVNVADANSARHNRLLVENKQEIVSENDLECLLHFLEAKDQDATWHRMMEHSTPNMAFQAWRQEPETGPMVYKTRTVYEDATPEMVRDFFWDDEFRPTWDPMLSFSKILQECPYTGLMIVQSIKKFPFFCSDREYIIGRRIWEAGNTYYCVTKGVPYPSLAKRDDPWRVDLYFSSWIIRPVESRKGDGKLSACEVILFHYEDVGLPKDVAKFGVQHGMWGAIKQADTGMRVYQNAKKAEAAPSGFALLARITTKMPSEDSVHSAALPIFREEERAVVTDVVSHKKDHTIDWTWLGVGGSMVLACGLHTGAIGRALVLGAGLGLSMGRAWAD